MEVSERHFTELGIPHFSAVFAALDDVLQQHGVPCYLIGAAAKDLQMLRQGIKPIRFTNDIDFAIMMPDHAAYRAIMAAITSNGFHGTRETYRVVHTATDTVVDILPFGDIEEKGTVRFTDRDTELVMLGFSDVLATAEPIDMAGGRTLHVPPLPGMCLLKLLAYGDRPERTKDLADILSIIGQYYDAAIEVIAAEHADLLDADPFDRNTCAARVIGRTMGTCIRANADAVAHIIRLLDPQLREPETSSIAKHWAAEDKVTVELAFAWLHAMRQGILERTTP